MKITLPVADGKTLTYASLQELATHYGRLADAYGKRALELPDIKQAAIAEGKSLAYSNVCWQISRMKIENDPACTHTGEPGMWCQKCGEQIVT
jgi:hypothetical protein